jgi:iron complex transport system substrate-binding protein
MIVPVQRPPQSIVSRLAAGREILCDIGCGNRLVGVSHECDYPTRVERLPRLTRSRVDDTKAR